jgi:uncharacterized oxidoreductase
MQLSGNTVLITGGTSGIGAAFAEKFLQAGSKVIITGRREERLKKIQEDYPEMIVKTSDVADEKQREDLARWIMENHPGTNILINNAGVQLLTDLKKPVDLHRIRQETETNFIAPVHLTSIFAQHLAAKQNAAIVNISSGLAFVPIAIMPVYCATKAAIHSLTLSLRHQLRNTGIKVFEIIPPAVDTELGSDRREDKTQSHGGMPVHEFIEQAMHALETDNLEAAIGNANHSREKREALFAAMNSRWS